VPSRTAFLLLAAVLAALGACAPPEPSGPWNVVVLLVDTLRADRLPLHGYPRETSPALAALAEDSVVFERARAQAGCTFPSVASLLTSRPASEIMAGIGRHGMAVPEGLPYLPAILRERGWATAAVSASIVVRDTPSQINRQGGYGRGFDVFDESCLERSAACVNARAVPLLDELPEPFFLYLHYLDPHAPYRPPSWHERRFARSRPERRWVRRGEVEPIFRTLYEGEPGGEIDRAELRHLGDLYDEEVLFFDRQLDHLLAELRSRGLLERTALVLLSDHGEELLDHGHFGHCRNLAYESLLHTPLVIRLPGGRAAGRRSQPVDNLDLVPTLLAYLGVEPAGRGFAGRNLRPWLDGGDPPPARLHFALQGTVRTATDGRWKLLVDLASGRMSLYDLAADPDETRDLAGRRPEEALRLRRAVARWVEESEGGDAAEAVRRARQHERELEALGYL